MNCYAPTHILTHTCQGCWGCRIYRVHLWREVILHRKCPGYYTKQSDGKVPVMLDIWGMRSTPSLLSLPVPIWPGVVAPDNV